MAILNKVHDPPAGKLYHGVYPGKMNGDGVDVTRDTLKEYVDALQKKVAWVYFSNEWSHSQAFPVEQARWIWENNSVPFIRLMLRSQLNDADTHYTETRLLSRRAVTQS
jgi:hypothetical protein